VRRAGKVERGTSYCTTKGAFPYSIRKGAKKGTGKKKKRGGKKGGGGREGSYTKGQVIGWDTTHGDHYKGAHVKEIKDERKTNSGGPRNIRTNG